LVHLSGHKSRLDRDLKNRFGSRDYAAEEPIAELGAAVLCAEFGFDGDVRNAGYIANWIELLKADKRAFFTACSQASKAADYLRGLALAEASERAEGRAASALGRAPLLARLRGLACFSGVDSLQIKRLSEKVFTT
jgi:antirestriction protein ArdC